ncbi:hypothetical protein [Pedobacter sp. D749]|uniref:hypothetical protein n=1 Tax=Pedobacter sp. D749 TaxID=2856523 RepID=UPI001C5A2ADE|nr:hypothetical protein [Pedobacter sp. D749]QXU40998.1 hypothetical protein KYH19_18665 [Pedobacter sp. D749]
MNKLSVAIVFCAFIVVALTGCGEKFNAKSEKEFEASKARIVKNLNKEEQVNLEKALRVIALESMRLKWNESEKYKGKSFDKISLEMIDGLRYSSVVNLAEDLLQAHNKKEIAKVSAEIDTLEIQKKELIVNNQKLDIFKVTSLTITEDDFFGEKVPELDIEYAYTGKQALTGGVAVKVEVREISTLKVIVSQIWGDAEEVGTLNPGDSMNGNVMLREAKENNPAKWKNVKYPLTNPKLADFDLKLELIASSITTNGKIISLPKYSVDDIDAEIKKKKAELKELQETKGTLDELELTNK